MIQCRTTSNIERNKEKGTIYVYTKKEEKKTKGTGLLKLRLCLVGMKWENFILY